LTRPFTYKSIAVDGR